MILSIKGADFLCQNDPLVCERKQPVSLIDRRTRVFLLGDEMKRCHKCGEVKSLDKFTRRSKTDRRYNTWCKECRNLHSLQYKIEHREEIHQYNTSPKQRRKYNEAQKKAQKNPILRKRHLTRWRANWVIRIKEPCVLCKKPDAEKHHCDYDKPYVIVWLCYYCHKLVHRNKIDVKKYERDYSKEAMDKK